jgi:cytochrome c oxidase subunit 4
MVISLSEHLPGGAFVTIGPEIDPRHARALPFVAAWAVMLLLAGLSLWTAFLGTGVWAPVVQYGIAALQTAILFILFMRLKGPPSLKWVFAVSGFLWLLFLYGLSMTDYGNRRGWPLMYYPNGPSYQNLQDRPLQNQAGIERG